MDKKGSEITMSTVLYIKANAKPEGQSRTFTISDAFVEEYKKNHPEDNVVTLDLYEENIQPLSGADLGAAFGPKDESSKSHKVLQYAYQFAQADKYIISAPMWNLSFPAIVKSYIDYVSIVGIAFEYTAQGPVGVLKNKKALHVVTRGGSYSEGPFAAFEQGDRYLRTIFGFFGVVDFTTIAGENLDVHGADVAAIVSQKLEEAKQLAKTF